MNVGFDSQLVAAHRYPAGFDWKKPDYPAVFRERLVMLAKIRKEPDMLPGLKAYYKEHPAQFISDWGATSDPRNLEVGLPAVIPFILFPRQVEFVYWLMARWQAREPGLCEKSRDMGVSWLCAAMADTLGLFYSGLVVGFGSRKADLVDKIGDPDSLFWKVRQFLILLPPEFRGGWDDQKDTTYMHSEIPTTGSIVKGESGDNIGRGGRSSLYLVDEAAHLERPEVVDAALSQTTNCRIDLSSVKGRGNPFAQKRFSWPAHRVFVFDWRDDPRKDQEWYDGQVEKLQNPQIIAQEIDRNYAASVEGVVIPDAWVHAAVDAHVKLGIKPTGKRSGALDVADEGQDLNAYCGGYGILVTTLDDWTGQGGDIFKTVQKAFSLCDDDEAEELRYDADGLGAGARGDARIINETRTLNQMKPISVVAFRGSEAVANPREQDVPGRYNEDYFANRKAQCWWSLRKRFQMTYRWVVEGKPCDPDEIISLSSRAKGIRKLTGELSQPTYDTNAAGKMLINKTPDGARSPNLADALMIWASNVKRAPMSISTTVVQQFAQRRG